MKYAAQCQKRQFSNIHKSTINLDSKLARDEMVLIVDENDQPVRSATRLEMVSVNHFNGLIEIIKFMA
jgi:hypothetical protein